MNASGLVLQTLQELSALPAIQVLRDAPLSAYTRFGIGGPADIFVSTGDPATFAEAWRIVESSGMQAVVIGGGTNLIVSDAGFRGVVLKLSNHRIQADGLTVHADSGASLQALVDYTVDAGLAGLETMTGIPGSTGAAVYGNAGAYGHSIMERVTRVHYFDGAESPVREFTNAQCEFRYRESIFKRHKGWVIFSTELTLDSGDAVALRAKADEIRAIRDRKYPPTMKCAGSIFKNYLLAELPAHVVSEIPAKVIIEGKVPSAWFLEQVNAKGMRAGDIRVAEYHANLIYNEGNGSAHDLLIIIDELKKRVGDRWGIPLQEEVQYVGFPVQSSSCAHLE